MPGFVDNRKNLDNSQNYVDLRGSQFYADAVYDNFSKKEYQRRHKLVRSFMEKEQLDCLVIGGGGYHFSSCYGVGWLTGHTREWHSMAVYLVFPRDGEPTLVYSMGGPQLEAARRSVVIDDVRPSGTQFQASSLGHFGDVIVARLKELKLEDGNIGITDCDSRFHDYMPVNQYNAMVENLPQARFRFIKGLFHELWSIKSDEEVDAIEKAALLCDRAVEAMVDRAKPGVREYELRAAAANAIIEGGGDFNFLIIGSTPMSNPKMFFGNVRPSARILQEGDIVIDELAAEYKGFHAQIGTPICVGTPTAKVKEFFDNIVLPGFQTLEETLKPGNTLEDVRSASTFFRQRGYQSGPVIMHGLGVSSEGPEVTVQKVNAEPYEFQMQPNMTFMLEPDPIIPEGTFGILLGHSFLITKTGRRRLTQYPLQLTVA